MVKFRARMPGQAPHRLQQFVMASLPLPCIRRRGFFISSHAELALHVEVVLSLLH